MGRRLMGLALAVVMVATGCQVQLEDVVQESATAPVRDASSEPATPNSSESESPVATGVLPALGPLPAASHWHAAYVIRICDDVLAPVVSENDPLGIHTHGDGLMHVHPFFEESGYEQATIGLFADAVGLGLSTGELTLPTGGTWRDGDLCNGVPGRVFVDRWEGPLADSPVERIFTDFEAIRFTGDAELYQIAFAPEDSVPVVPPSAALLPEVSNLAEPPEPWIEVPPGATRDQVSLWPVGQITGSPCGPGQIREQREARDDRCFDRGGEPLAALDGVASARAVLLNRRPALELTMAAPLQGLIADHFAVSGDPFVFAIEIDGAVATVAQLARNPVSDRLVIASGFDEEAARAMAVLLTG